MKSLDKEVKGLREWNMIQDNLNEIGKHNMIYILQNLMNRICQPVELTMTFSDTPTLKGKRFLFQVFPGHYDEKFNFLDCEEYQIDSNVLIVAVRAKDNLYILPVGEWERAVSEIKEEREAS